MTEPIPEAAADLRRLAAALAQAVGMPLAAEHLPGVADNLGRLLAQAQLLMQQAVATDTEPAPVFRP